MKMFFALAPALVLTAIAAWSPGAEAANLLKNPGFETGDFTGWIGGRNSKVTSITRNFLPETILTGNYGARIFPGDRASTPIFLFQQFTLPNAVDRLRFGGNLRFFSFEPFADNLDRGSIWLFVNPELSIDLGIRADGLPSTLASNKRSQASDWLLFEHLVDVSGLGGQTAFFILQFKDEGVPRDTAVAFDDLFVEVVPVPTPALLPGLVGLGLAVWRKKAGDREF